MFGGTSPYSWSSGYEGSLRSAGTTGDETSSELSSLSRPSAKSIYLQRKDYADSINRQMHQCQYHVEHLFTCELDGQQISSVHDCVERLKVLDATGRVWAQDVILEAGDGTLLLKDIETKEQLESWSFSSIVDMKAVLDASVSDSLLTLSVQDDISRVVSVFLFQSESLRADYLKEDLERLLQHKTRDHSKRANSLEMVPQNPLEHWIAPDYDDSPVPTPPVSRNTSTYIQIDAPAPPPPVEAPPPQRPYTERERDVDILNHLISDIEAFVDRVEAVTHKTKKKKKKRKQTGVKGMPSEKEFTVCLQKIKMAFNLLAKLHGQIENPSAEDLTHCLFTTLELIVCQCAEDVPQSVVAPLLEPQCIMFLSELASAEEDQLWQSLGDPWNIPSTRWPEDEEFIPTFTPVFDDGWNPPEIRDPEPKTPARKSVVTPTHNVKAKSNKSVKETPESRVDDVAVRNLRAKFDFRARDDRELTISKGEKLQLLDMSKQWWKVRNGDGRVGYVPNNMLESEEQQKSEFSSVLSRRSRPQEVQAWLEHMGFSRITVRCLGGLSGSMLLGMTREELKVICPEEGGRVFHQLQNVLSSLAMSSAVKPVV